MELAVHDLGCDRAGRRVVDGVSFVLRPGDALVVTGRNGAGKSTLLAALAGLLRPASGTIQAAGLGERTLPESLHFVAQRDALKGTLTASENLRFWADLLGGVGLEPEAALGAVGLPGAAEVPVAYLSAGQRRRVALARLLVRARPLWLLDEPTLALDVAGQAMLHDLLRQHLGAGGIAIVATHAPLRLVASELHLGPPQDGSEPLPGIPDPAPAAA